MTSSLDMSLDDLIKNNKKSTAASGGRGRGRGSGGPTRRFPNRSGNRPGPYSMGKAPDSAWPHDMYANQTGGYSAPAARVSSIETGTKLYISNLDYGVSNEDIKELFSEVGDLKRYSIHYDRSGRSKGTAEVVFSRRADALAAIKRYNNVQLDGKPMKIEIVGMNIETPAAAPQIINGAFGSLNGPPKRFVSEYQILDLNQFAETHCTMPYCIHWYRLCTWKRWLYRMATRWWWPWTGKRPWTR
ncbi:THO complex subunit 4A isoform X1 [Elaeis guineensis]|uniref:THO complex subunit 4A isoform X1 n=1 Tax=Elaeis guineensis var. tenera TaxID=51953 RepID=A0A8N4EZ48_ELAGV|nr:THO complex subunit 4A isoform X1 [Elaeis guineensis]